MKNFFKNMPWEIRCCFGAILLSVLFLHKANAWIPSLHGVNEVRVIAKTVDGFDSGEFDVEGKIIGSHILNDDLHLSGLFKLGNGNESESKLGGALTYRINDYVSATALGDVSHARAVGGTFILHGHFGAGSLVIMPFASINDKKLADVGLVNYLDLGGVYVSFGAVYHPKQGDMPNHNISIVLGTSVDIGHKK